MGFVRNVARMSEIRNAQNVLSRKYKGERNHLIDLGIEGGL